MLRYFETLDGNVLLWIQNHMRNDVLTDIFKNITKLGNGGAIWILISVLLLVPKKTRQIGILSLISLVLTALIDIVIIKNLVGRTRPYEVITELTSAIGVQGGYSFPSGHTSSSFASAVVLFCMLPKRYGIPALALAIVIGFSRLYVGVHYPSDVLFGALSGTIIALIICWIYKEKKYENSRLHRIFRRS